MSEITPIKRHEAIQPLSREHHHGLLLCFRIRVGLQRNIDTARIKQYVDWFWTNHLKEHFDIEEKYVFPVLDTNDEMFIRAHVEHRRLEALISQQTVDGRTLDEIAKILEGHIRFEERIMFNKIQEIATEEQLKDIFAHHDQQIVCDDWQDPYWKSVKREEGK
jgi:hemerythrin-like domain-containing protein